MADYTLSVKLTGDVKQMEKEFARVIKSINTLKEKTNSATGQGSTFNQKLSAIGSQLDSTGMKMMKFGGKATLGITTPLALAKKQMISAASDFEENINKVEVAFGDYANTVKDWSKTTTKQFGISRNAALEMTALFGDMGTSMGLTRQDASKMSMSLTGLAGDLASFKNVNIDVAQTALKGIFTGETESLKNLGIVMTQANLQNYALSKGITKKVEAMTEAEKVQLRYNYVMDAAKNAQGDYARTSDGAANSIRTFQATMENLAQTLGKVLLPSFTEIIQTATGVVQKFAELDPNTQKLIVKFALLAAAVGPATTAIGVLTSATGKTISTISNIPRTVSKAKDGFDTLRIHALYAKDAIKAFSTSTMTTLKTSATVAKTSLTTMGSSIKTMAVTAGANLKSMAMGVASSMRVLAVSIWTAVAPILPMIIAIGLLVGAFVYLFKTNEEFRNSMLESWEEIKAAFVPLVDALKTLFESVVKAIMPAVKELGKAFSGIVKAIMPIITGIAKVFAGIVVIIAKVVGKVAQILGTIISVIAKIIGKVVGAITPIIAKVAEIFARVGEAITSVVTPAINILSGILNAIVGFLTSYVIPVITSIITVVINVITKIIQVITPIITFIAGVVGKMISIIAGIVNVVGAVFGAVKNVITSIWNGITSFIGGAISAIVSIVKAIVSPFTAVFNAIKSVVTGVVGGIKSAWSGLKGFFSNLFGAIVAIVKAPINAIISSINFFIRGLNKIRIPDWVPKIGGKGIHISEIPHLARGTDNWQGGFARMNEGGRGELTYLPNGSVVVPHDISRTYAKESARVNNTSVGFDVSRLGEYIVTAITSQGARLADGIERGISGITMVADRREIGRMVSDLGFERR